MFSSLETPPDAAIRFFTFSVSFALFLRQDLAREKSDLILKEPCAARRLEGWMHGNDSRPSFETRR